MSRQPTEKLGRDVWAKEFQSSENTLVSLLFSFVLSPFYE